MDIPKLQIGDLTAPVPIVQGGMGIGISLSNLAAAVANFGGIGVISAAEPGFNFDGYNRNKLETNLKALKYHIQRARKLSPKGIIGVNIMTAINHFEKMVKAAVNEGVDIIFSGAGLPMNLPKFVKESKTKIAPIVSSGRVAKLICRQWDRKYQYLPDAIVVEGPEAGGHLGFSTEQLENIKDLPLTKLVKEVKDALKTFEEKYQRRVPIIAGGGIHDGKDIVKILSAGASAVQMATRFVATYECDADDKFKQSYINAGKEDVMIINSPVGMPGRAIRNKFVEKVYKKQKPQNIKCINCLKPCNPQNTPYCIADALINAQKGELDKGFAFAGAKVYKINRITSVKKLIDKLMEEVKSYKKDMD
ncbi:NAD(P)H-dependent flavin oxidoreductase [Thermohalobacter berrensis]|uniref:Probable nitronate monooxygenase n=1 Tax=Thermohalobacter berrensis TaxID=99594 RepID=A0A419T7N6_9FIRM|nr:nitronate monooxygenase family protein [Thermohalobacter berrensis]RKD33449.1 2-nitropropane dioxygenase [Thermohalobacter berrensis]